MIDFKIGPKIIQYAFVITANLTFFQFGITIGWMSPAMVKLSSENQTALPQPVTETEIAWIVSSSSLVSLFAFPFIGYIANGLGRKTSIIAAVIPRIVTCFLVLFGSRVWMLLLGRALCGLSDMFTIAIGTTYTSEIASKEIRGGLGSVSQIFSALGSMLMLSVGPYVSYVALNIIQTTTIIFTFTPLLFLPESPYFLYSKGKTSDAIKLLTYLRGDSTKANEELKEYSMNKAETLKIKDVISDRVTMKAIGIVICLAVSSQMTGYNAVMLYLQIIFTSSGTSVTPEISSLIIGCIQLFACACTILLTDKFGRKPVLMITLLFSALGMVGLGTFFKLKGDGTEITGFLNYLPLISVILVIYCFNAGMGALVWILMAELFEGPTRVVGVSVGAFTATIFTFLTTRYFSLVTAALGPATTYWMFSGSSTVACIFIAIFVPETKRKPFSQIQRELGRR